MPNPQPPEPTERERLLCDLAGCLRTHPYPLADLFDKNPPRCPQCGSSDTFEMDCWGHPFGTYSCRRCNPYTVCFTKDGGIIYDLTGA